VGRQGIIHCGSASTTATMEKYAYGDNVIYYKEPAFKACLLLHKRSKKVRHIQINFRKRIFFNIREIIIQKQPYYDCYRVQGKVRKYSVQGDIFKQKSYFFRQIRRFVYFTSSFLSIEKNSITLLF